MKINKLLGLGLLTAVFFASCTDEEIVYKEAPAAVAKGAYERGVLVVNEGNFGSPNAEVSYISSEFPTLFQNNIFNTVNPTKVLGNTAQSIGFNGDLAYIVLNGSNKIEVVNRYTFVSVATIQTGLQNPRYIAFANGKGYVTNWGDAGVTTDDYVAIVISHALNSGSQSAWARLCRSVMATRAKASWLLSEHALQLIKRVVANNQ
ncbi:MAG: hypothetical protein E2604_10455, partial [Flavobacterium sp.]|nr:hypothetical protein [Flavobacterium sp.]